MIFSFPNPARASRRTPPTLPCQFLRQVTFAVRGALKIDPGFQGVPNIGNQRHHLGSAHAAHKVIGVYDGFQWLIGGDKSHIKELDHDDVSRLHFHGGSMLNTSRANPTKNSADLERVVATLESLGIGYLAAIGGDDTMFAASEVAKLAGGRIHVRRRLINISVRRMNSATVTNV